MAAVLKSERRFRLGLAIPIFSLTDPGCWTQCWMLTSVWVRKPLG
jgi:hypothetical protein